MRRRLLTGVFVVSWLAALLQIATLGTNCSGTSSADIQCTVSCDKEGSLVLLDAGIAVLVGLALWAARRVSPGRLVSEVGVNAVHVFGVGYLVAFRFLLILALAGYDVPGCVWMG